MAHALCLPCRHTHRDGLKLVDAFNKTMDIPVRTYEVYGFGTGPDPIQTYPILRRTLDIV